MAEREDLLTLSDCGLYCPAGGFAIDPWKPVDRAIVTHAHGDHARPGMGRYLTSAVGAEVLRLRVGEDAAIDTLAYGERVKLGDVTVSFHPAGHILGSSQVRLERDGEVWVVTGDYKVEPDPTCEPFDLVRCHTLVTESTFGLPIYRWPDQAAVFEQIHAWWRGNQAAGKASIVEAYTLGKAQRVLAGLDESVGPIFVHGAVRTITDAYRAAGVRLPRTRVIGEVDRRFDWSTALIVAPPGAHATPWGRRFGDQSTAFCSGWMRIRGARRRRAVDRGFVLSDHVDWPALLATVEATGAERVLVTHGYSAVVSQFLREKGLRSEVVPTQWEGEQDAAEPEEPDA